MSTQARYGLEQARSHLPAIAAQAFAGVASVITRHGKPYAAVVSIDDLNQAQSAAAHPAGVLALRGTGQGLWGPSASKAVAELRDEWGD